MPSVASVHPLWPVTLRSLRELTRLAVAALALAVGLGTATATPATSPAPSAPALSAVTIDAPSGAGGRTAARLAHAEPAGAVALPTADRPDDAPATAAVRPAAQSAGPAHDLGRGVPGRRGPPTA